MVYKSLPVNHRSPQAAVAGTALAALGGMWKRIARLFIIKTRFEACAVIYALSVGAVGRGYDYLAEYPGPLGWLLFAACTAAVFMAGARIMEMTRRDSGRRRRKSDLPGAA